MQRDLPIVITHHATHKSYAIMFIHHIRSIINLANTNRPIFIFKQYLIKVVYSVISDNHHTIYIKSNIVIRLFHMHAVLIKKIF